MYSYTAQLLPVSSAMLDSSNALPSNLQFIPRYLSKYYLCNLRYVVGNIAPTLAMLSLWHCTANGRRVMFVLQCMGRRGIFT